MKLCVFGSSSASLAPIYLSEAEALGRAIALHGHELVFGGYDTGLMGAVASGAAEMGGCITGVIPESLEGKGRKVFPCTTLETTPNLAERKNRMIALSDDFIALPGGLGTFDELFSVLSLEKAGEIDSKSALLNVAEYFNPLIRMFDDAYEKGLNSTNWREGCEVFTNPEELVSWIEK